MQAETALEVAADVDCENLMYFLPVEIDLLADMGSHHHPVVSVVTQAEMCSHHSVVTLYIQHEIIECQYNRNVLTFKCCCCWCSRFLTE